MDGTVTISLKDYEKLKAMAEVNSERVSDLREIYLMLLERFENGSINEVTALSTLQEVYEIAQRGRL